jgi:hypothetical protein
LFVPLDCLRRQILGREGLRHVADGDLVIGEGELGHQPLKPSWPDRIRPSTSVTWINM